MNDLINQYLATRRASTLAEAHLAPAAQRVHLHPAKAVALVLLSCGDPQPVSYLGRALSVQPQTMTELADNLERAGLVCRQRHPTDRRIVRLALTPKGEEVAAAFLAALGEAGGPTRRSG